MIRKNILKVYKVYMYIYRLFVFLLIDVIIFFLEKIEKKREKYEDDIAIIKLDGIGDFFLWMNTFSYYIENLVGKKITLICSIEVEEIAKNISGIDEVIAINKKKILSSVLYRIKTLRIIRAKEYIKVLSPTYSRDFWLLDWTIKSTISNEKIGFYGDLSNINSKLKRISNKWYTTLIDCNKINEIEKYKFFTEKLFNIEIIKIEKSYKILKNFIFQEKKNKSCIIFLGSSYFRKNWELSKYKEIIKIIPKEYKVYLCGGKDEEKLGEKIFYSLKVNKKIINLIGKLNLYQVLKLINTSNIVIGNDTSCIHMANFVETKSICILGQGQYGRFFPYSNCISNYCYLAISTKCNYSPCNWRCKYELKEDEIWPCIANIDILKVKNILDKIV